MEWALGTGVVLGMFLLRLMVPVLVTVALSFALHRLDAKWHRDEGGQPETGRGKHNRAQGTDAQGWILGRRAS